MAVSFDGEGLNVHEGKDKSVIIIERTPEMASDNQAPEEPSRRYLLLSSLNLFTATDLSQHHY